jgi:hypothetical protein
MDSDADSLVKNLNLMGPSTLDQSMISQYGARASAKDVLCYQCLFMVRCIDQVLLQKQKELRIGFIGCGQIGSTILNALLESGFPGDRLSVTTRMPEKLGKRLQSKGVVCTKDSSQVVSASDVLILCIPPAQITPVASALRGRIKKRTTLISVLIGVTETKIRQIFGVRKVLRAIVDVSALVNLGPPPSSNEDDSEEDRQKAVEYSDAVLDIAMQSLAQGGTTTTTVANPEDILPPTGDENVNDDADEEPMEVFDERFAGYAAGTKILVRSVQALAMSTLAFSQKQAMRAAEYIVLGVKRDPVADISSVQLPEEGEVGEEGEYDDEEQDESRGRAARAAMAAMAASCVSIVPGHQWVSYDGPQGGDDSFHEGFDGKNQGQVDSSMPSITSHWLPFVEEVREGV